MRSVGVTATTLSTAPATMPARIPREVPSLPASSIKTFLIESKARNLTPALNVVPWAELAAVRLHDGGGSETHDD